MCVRSKGLARCLVKHRRAGVGKASSHLLLSTQLGDPLVFPINGTALSPTRSHCGAPCRSTTNPQAELPPAACRCYSKCPQPCPNAFSIAPITQQVIKPRHGQFCGWPVTPQQYATVCFVQQHATAAAQTSQGRLRISFVIFFLGILCTFSVQCMLYHCPTQSRLSIRGYRIQLVQVGTRAESVGLLLGQ